MLLLASAAVLLVLASAAVLLLLLQLLLQLLQLLLQLCDSARATVTIMMWVSVDSSWTDPGIV